MTVRKRFPRWSFVRCGDLANDTTPGFRTLYDRIRLWLKRSIEGIIVEYTSEENQTDT